MTDEQIEQEDERAVKLDNKAISEINDGYNGNAINTLLYLDNFSLEQIKKIDLAMDHIYIFRSSHKQTEKECEHAVKLDNEAISDVNDGYNRNAINVLLNLIGYNPAQIKSINSAIDSIRG